jgi:hypothetical protein
MKGFFQRNRATIIGIGVAFACAMTDMFVLNAMFISGNISSRDALAAAILGGIVLDIPPYLLGIVVANRNDIHIEKQDEAKYRLSFGFLFAVIIIAFLVYILVQVSIFIGGGDFTVGYRVVFLGFLQSVNISEELLRASDDVNPGNAIQAVIPLVTSAVSYAVGLIQYEPRINIWKREEQLLREDEIKWEAKLKEKESEFESTARSVAIKLGYSSQIENIDDTAKVITALFSAYHENSVIAYKEAYTAYLKKIRAEAAETINEFTVLAAPHTAYPGELNRLDMNDRERDVFKYIAEPEEGATEKIKIAIQKVSK